MKSHGRKDIIPAPIKINRRAQYLIAPRGKGSRVFFGKP
jgi:hypothetical protein